MAKLINNKIFLIFVSLFLVGGLCLFALGEFRKLDYRKKVAEAKTYNPVDKTGQNMSGFAYSENFGWVSFNSDDTGSAVDYGVNINRTTGTTTGFAWSENVGWIAFQRIDVCSNDNSRACNILNSNADCVWPGICEVDMSFPGYDDFTAQADGNCAAVCTLAEKCTACYNRTNHKIYGWAKVVSLGSDGWIKLQKLSVDLAGGDYGLIVDPATKNVTNYAWNGNTDPAVGMGWLSFSCLNDSSCVASGYQVKLDIGNPPSVNSLTAPNVNPSNFCQETVLQAFLRWEFDDTFGTQSAYQIVLTGTDSTVFDTGKCTSMDVGKCKIDPSSSQQYPLTSAELTVGTTYSWTLEVWDNDEMSSGVESGPDFTIPVNEYPKPFFSISPAQPSIGEETILKSFGLVSRCGIDGSLCSYEWTQLNGNVVFANWTASSTMAKFMSDSASAKLLVTEISTGFACATSSPSVTSKKKLPIWREAK